MGRTRWQTLLVVAVLVGAVAVVLTVQASRRGSGMPQVPWLVVAVELLIAAVVFAMGWAVRQFLRGKRPDLSPIRAARTAVLAKACCYTGAPLAGWYGGQALGHLIDALPGSGMRAAAAGVAAGGALVMAVVGLVVEGFCQVPPPQDDEAASRPMAPDPAAG
jgi:hypothetical protein